MAFNIKSQGDEIDLGKIIGLLLDSKWVIAITTVIFAFLGILFALFSTPIYKSDALIQIEQSASSNLLGKLSDVLPDARPQSAPEIELITSRMVIGKTVKELGLDVQVKEKLFPVVGKGLARLTGRKLDQVVVSRLDVPEVWLNQVLKLEVQPNGHYTLYADDIEISGEVGKTVNSEGFTILISDIETDGNSTFTLRKLDTLTAVNSVLENLSVADKTKDGGILQLSMLGENRSEISKILNSISNNYLQQNVERKSEEAGKSLEFLNEQLPLIKEGLDSSENKLNQFRQQNDSVDLSLEAKSVLDTMVSVESQLNELTFKEAEISKLYTRSHPAYKALMEKRATLQKEKDKLNKRVSSMPKTQQEILRLTRDVQAGQDVYMVLLNKQQELNINKASTVGNVRIIDRAMTQPLPVKPKKGLIVVLAVLCGLIVSAAYVFIRDFLKRGINHPGQLEELGITVYAAIPLSERFAKRRGRGRRTATSDEGENGLLAQIDPTDLAIEAIRGLRTSLHFAMMESANNILMICGATPGIGKTFVSANLAASIALSGRRVLLIDCDMRKGYTHKLFNCPVKGGLSEYLSEQKGIADIVHQTEVDGLHFIARGRIPQNPSELLMSNQFSTLLSTLSSEYDLIILDTPPIIAVTEGAIVGRYAGTALMVARFEQSTVKEIEIGISRFEQNGIEIKGVILNAVEKRASSAYSYGNYSHYKYGND